MFELNNIINYTAGNIQIIGVFIAIIGGLVATKLLNARIERDSLLEKKYKLEKEIDFYDNKNIDNKAKVNEIKRQNYIEYIYKYVLDKDFNIENYEDYDLSIEQRINIVDEIKEMMAKAFNIFQVEHTNDEISYLLQQNQVREGTAEYMVYEYIGKQTRKRKTNKFGFIDPTDIDIPSINSKSLSESLEERDMNDRINKFNEVVEWKRIEKDDINSKLRAINCLDMKNDVILFISITVLAIIIPQIVLCIYPLFYNFKFLKYIFAIYSIVIFIISMILMLMYIYKLFLNAYKQK